MYPCGADDGNVTVTLAPSAMAAGGLCRVALTRQVRVWGSACGVISRSAADACTDGALRRETCKTALSRGGIASGVAISNATSRSSPVASVSTDCPSLTTCPAEAFTAVMTPACGAIRRVQPRLSRAFRHAASLLFKRALATSQSARALSSCARAIAPVGMSFCIRLTLSAATCAEALAPS